MIINDQELNATLERIRHLQNQVAHLRKVETNTGNCHLSASGFLAEIDRMQLAVREYRSLHPGELKASA
jgi:Ni2+-binding GTPase involved in maturation of urease and hydrogenase